MARDEEFIPMRLALAEDPRVAQIAMRASLDLDQTLGKLYRVWSWVRRHTDNGQARKATVEWIDRLVGCPGFSAALISQDWLRERKGGGLTFPNAAQWIDKDSHTREVERNRKRRMRGKLNAVVSRDGPGTVTGHVPTLSRDCPADVPADPLPSSPSPAPSPSLSPITPLLSSSSPPIPTSPTPGSSEPQQAAASEPPFSPVMMIFETVGQAKAWGFTEAHGLRLAQAFGNVDIVGEARKAHTWLQANPTKRKTPRGMAAFLWRWMEKCANRGGASPVNGNGAASHPSPAERRRDEYEKAISEVK